MKEERIDEENDSETDVQNAAASRIRAEHAARPYFNLRTND